MSIFKLSNNYHYYAYSELSTVHIKKHDNHENKTCIFFVHKILFFYLFIFSNDQVPSYSQVIFRDLRYANFEGKSYTLKKRKKKFNGEKSLR